MLKHLMVTSTLILPIGAQATPLTGEYRTAFVGGATVSCIADAQEQNKGFTFKFSQTEMASACGCIVDVMANNTTLEQYTSNNIDPLRFVPDIKVCLNKYLRKWWQFKAYK